MKYSPGDWATTGGDAGKSHHSLLIDISAKNVGRLGLAWAAELGINRVLEATQIVIDGVIYTSGVAAAHGKIFVAALDAKLYALDA
jgi:quinohemoprotein ethanol dehydrogenase